MFQQELLDARVRQEVPSFGDLATAFASISPAAWWVFWFVIGLCILSGVILLVLSALNAENDSEMNFDATAEDPSYLSQTAGM